MNLNVTWTGPVGPDINYRVDYRSLPDGEFINFSTTIHTNYVVIPNLPDGFYEVRSNLLCGAGPSPFQYATGGKPSCTIPVYTSYQVISDTETEQTIRVSFTDGVGGIKARVTRLEDNRILVEETVGSLGTYEVSLPKSGEQASTFRIEIAHICGEFETSFVNMGEYSVQQMSDSIPVIVSKTCSCSGMPSVIFTEVETSQVYSDVEYLPKGLYNIYVVVPKQTCTTNGHVNIKVYSNEVLTIDLNSTVIPNDVNYTSYFEDVDLYRGADDNVLLTPTKVEINFSCS